MKREGSAALPSRHWQAAIILRARQELAALNLPPDADLNDVLEATGSSRSTAYGLASDLPGHLPDRGVGRPPKEAAEPDTERLRVELAVTRRVRDYMAEHPGAVTKRDERQQYSDSFRSFALDLIGPGGMAECLTTAQAAEALGVSVNTLNGWLHNGPRKLRKAADDTAAPAGPATNEPGTASWSKQADLIVAAWDVWEGTFSSFCDAMRERGIETSRSKIAQILFASGRRKRRPRSKNSVDSEAVRGTLEHFFPGAQVGADGKYVEIEMDGERHRFCWHLVTDVNTGAFLGFDVRDHEDSTGFINAYEQAKVTVGSAPAAALRDNRRCNISERVEDVLAADNVLSMTSRKGRPQTNGTTEGAFSLFEQSMPDLRLDTSSPRETARSAIQLVLTAFSSGRNLAPRKRLGAKTPVDAFRETVTDDDVRDEAVQRLTKLNRNARRNRRRTSRRREQPAVRKVMRDELKSLGVDDPRKGTIDKLADLGLDAAAEAAGILRAKVDNGLELSGDIERYLLKIGVNLANRNEDLAALEHVMRIREKAGELLLATLRDEEAHLAETLNDAQYLQAIAERSLEASSRIDRHFWWRFAVHRIANLPENQRATHARHLARKVATRYALHYRERDTLIGQLAKATTQLPGGM
jgi:transposase InsO family protein